MKINSNLVREVHVNIPFRLLKGKYLDFVLSNRINPEVGIDGDALDHFRPEDFEGISRKLSETGLSITLHAPFVDVVPGSPDRVMRNASVKRLESAFKLLDIFKPRTIVCHLGFDIRRYPSSQEAWMNASLQTWSELSGLAGQAGVKVMLENVYEQTPDLHFELLSRLDENFGFCFDIGHWNVWGKEVTMANWLDKLSGYLGQIHLHDNAGRADGHLSLGCGNIDFPVFFSYMDNLRVRPIVTLEPHCEEDLPKSLDALECLWPW